MNHPAAHHSSPVSPSPHLFSTLHLLISPLLLLTCRVSTGCSDTRAGGQTASFSSSISAHSTSFCLLRKQVDMNNEAALAGQASGCKHTLYNLLHARCKHRLWSTRVSGSDGRGPAGRFSELQDRLRVCHAVSVIIRTWRHLCVWQLIFCLSETVPRVSQEVFFCKNIWKRRSLDDKVWRSSSSEI